MSIASNFPAIRPSLNLDFANARALDPRITFSRASAATYYDGKTVAKAEENLLTRSQEFDSSAWRKSSCSIIADSTVAPDGTSTADTLVAASGSVSPFISNAINPLSTVTHTVSFYAKAGTHQFVQYSNNYGTGTFANFDLASGQVGSKGVLVIDSQIYSVGNGWYRCVVIVSAVQYTHFRLVPSATASYGALLSAAGTESVYIWGFQVEQRSQVTAYTPTTTQPITNYIPVLQTAPAGVPRFDHNPVTGESLGLLVEEQRTNLFTYSEQFGNAAFTKSFASVQDNVVVAPDGTFTADKMIESIGVSTHFVSSITTLSAGGTYTLSVYAKAAGRNTISLQFVNGSAGTNCFFDLASGTNTANNTFGGYGGSVGTPTITHVGNGWYRCSTTVTIDSTAVQSIRIGTTVSNGDGYSGVYIWGAQLEAGNFPTSYIKAEASQVTRAADSAQMTGTNFSSWYRQDEGVLLLHSRRPLLSAGAIQVSDGTTSNRMIVSGDASNFDRGYVTVDGAMDSTISVSSNTGGFDKKALAYRFNDIAYAKNGSAPGIDTASRVPVVNQLSVPTLTASFHIQKFSYYPKRLTNAQLQALTA